MRNLFQVCLIAFMLSAVCKNVDLNDDDVDDDELDPILGNDNHG